MRESKAQKKESDKKDIQDCKMTTIIDGGQELRYRGKLDR